MEPFEVEEFDYYVFLISCDWCSQLMSIHIGLNKKQMASAQNAARVAVEKIMSTCTSSEPDYLCTNMSVARKMDTWAFLEKKVDDKVSAKIKNFIIGQKAYTHAESIVLNVFLMILEECANPDKCMLFLDFLEGGEERLARAIDLWATGDFSDSDDAFLNSESDWDKYVISLFHEVPTTLSDFFDLNIENINSIDSLWGVISAKFDEDEKRKLIEALAIAYLDLTGNQCVVPSWL